MPIRIGRKDCRDFQSAASREWLVTNGIGGYASGTVSGANTRRYHGLLVASLRPPAQRVVLVAGVEEWLLLPGSAPVALAAQEYWDGTVFPEGFLVLESVELDGMRPVFTWTVGDRTIEKRVWMEPRVNRTVVAYRMRRGAPARLQVRPFFAHRDYHQQRHGQGSFTIAEAADGWAVDAEGVRTYLQARPAPEIKSRPDWYWRILHRVERERGLDDEEDLFSPGTIEFSLEADADVVIAVGTEALPSDWSGAHSREVSWAPVAQPASEALAGSPLTTQLAAAADQFRVVRGAVTSPSGGERRTIVAGYPWFVDWGRDTTISLPGLTLVSGNTVEARTILDTLMAYLDQGLLPNRFPDAGEVVEYNTIDATLWLFQALHAYLQRSEDWDFISERLTSLEEIIEWHIRGTYHGIRVDASDGLLAGGEEGIALTWMDARVGDWVVTPRRGKPVEVNALWFNALQLTADWCARAQRPSMRYRQMAQQAQESAARRFWNLDAGYLFDVVDTPDGDDASLRPNQLLALGLVYPLVDGEWAHRSLDQVTAHLLTPYGLRTLSRDDPRYQSSYRGDQRSRDAAYHMGTVWPWLLGPYLDAVKRLHGNPVSIDAILAPFEQHLCEAGLGTVSEIFEPEPPFRPAGCIAQAWSVAELLRHAVTSGTTI
ncbi:MAG: amylo-alpha-1,6-glucosidase [Candidatus Dormibacteraeota bacterium]|nr:amylo-alpha-1,6-glucosidase [Candidatus Dormibacteraeota bacterium]